MISCSSLLCCISGLGKFMVFLRHNLILALLCYTPLPGLPTCSSFVAWMAVCSKVLDVRLGFTAVAIRFSNTPTDRRVFWPVRRREWMVNVIALQLRGTPQGRGALPLRLEMRPRSDSRVKVSGFEGSEGGWHASTRF